MKIGAHGRQPRSEGANLATCASYFALVSGSAAQTGSQNSGEAATTFGHLRRGKLSGSLPGAVEGRIHRQAGVVLEEADETVFWLELLLEGGIMKHEKLDALVTEAQELTSIFVTSLRTAKGIAS
jgi:hypothetical protein